jgi:hypothetical protein
MSLIKMLKRMGSKIEPCGTPLYTVSKQALAIGKKTFKEQICFELKGIKIKCEEHVKLLGVTIDYELTFDKHISEICKKKTL